MARLFSPLAFRPGTPRGFRQACRSAGTGPRLEELEPRLVLSPVPTPDHVVIVIEENHAYSQIIGSSSAPYINSLAQQGANFTQSFAIEHPSQPNYLDFFSGSNQRVTNDNCPVGPFSAANLGSELSAQGLLFTGYSEDMPSVGYTGCTYLKYARKHNPWSDFSNVPTTDNKPFAGYFPSDYSTLPPVSIVVPNLNDDMHDGTIQQGDTWLRNNMSDYVNWTYTHNSLFIVTWDEDDSLHGNNIPTIFVGPMVNPGNYSEHITHYNVLRTVEDMYSTGYAGQSANVSPITDIWMQQAQVDHFVVTTSAANPDIAGTPFDVTVTAVDVNGNPVPSYTGTVSFSSADPYPASLPSNYTFTAGDAGTHTFPGGATLYTAGTWDVTATDPVVGVSGQAYVTVQAAPALQLEVLASGPVTSGVPFDVTVVAQDPYGNTDTNYQGTVTFSTTDSDPRVVLPPPYPFQPGDQGQATFPGGVTLFTQGNQTIFVNDDGGLSGNTTVTVNGPNLHPGALAQAVLPGAPGQAPAPVGTAGTQWTPSGGVEQFLAAAVGDLGQAQTDHQTAPERGLILSGQSQTQPAGFLPLTEGLYAPFHDPLVIE
jgi:phosphoesterase family protein